MNNIIKLIVKYHYTILFLVLEFVSVSLIITNNKYQQSIFGAGLNTISNIAFGGISNVSEFFSLRDINSSLIEENSKLNNEIERLKAILSKEDLDTLVVNEQKFYYQYAAINNISVNKNKNYITIDKGADDGIKVDDAICSGDFVVGSVESITNKGAVVMPLINVISRVSAKIKKNGFYGSLQWDGIDYQYTYLNDIAFHANALPGDTIVTSGFSSIFPEGKIIGFVEEIDTKNASFVKIKVKLAVDFKKVFDVYVITCDR